MSSNDDGATKSNKIGDALVTALGFEPTDSESQRQGEISEQMSDAGFTVTDVLDRDSDDDDVVDEDVADDLDSDDDQLDDDVDDLDESDDDDDSDEIVDSDDDEVDAEFDDDDLDDLDDSDDDDFDDLDDLDDDFDDEDDDEVVDELDADDESDDPDEAFVDSDEADASIGDVDESDVASADSDEAEDSDDESASLSAESEDAETVIDSVVDSTEESAASNGVSVSPGSSGFFGSRRSGFGRSGNKSNDKSGDKKVYADTAFPGVESDPDITLMPESPAITGEHDVIRIDDDEPTVVQTRDSVQTRGALDTVPSFGNITGWRPGGRRLQARKVRRVVRHIDPWSVLTFSVLFFLCLFAALLLASVLVWNVAEEAGTIENIENFILELGDYETFEIAGEDIFRAAVAIMGVFTLAASVIVVLLTVMFNLLSDLLGGIRITVIEEETVRVRPRRQLEAADTEVLE